MADIDAQVEDHSVKIADNLKAILQKGLTLNDPQKWRVSQRTWSWMGFAHEI